MSNPLSGDYEVSKGLLEITSDCAKTASRINNIFKNFHPHSVPTLTGNDVTISKEGGVRWSVRINDYPGNPLSTYVIECEVDRLIRVSHQIGNDSPQLEVNYSLNNGNSGLTSFTDQREGYFYSQKTIDESETQILGEVHEHLKTALDHMEKLTSFTQ